MNTRHFEADEILAQEPLGQSCPICESPILRSLVKLKPSDDPNAMPVPSEPTYWISCDCVAEQDFFGEAVLLDDKGLHKSIREVWAEEVQYLMATRPHLFPPDSLPGSLRES